MDLKREAKAFQAQLKADKRECACGRVAEVVVCEHLFHGYSHGARVLNFLWIWTGMLYCSECDYELTPYWLEGENVEPTMMPICRHCTKLIFDYALEHGPSITGPPFWFFQKGGFRKLPDHKGDKYLAGLTPEEKVKIAGPHKWARPDHLKAV